MSFKIFASGSADFHYVRDNNPDDDVFETASIISALQSSGPSVGGAIQGAADYVIPNPYMTGVQAMARNEFLHLLQNAVSFLAMHPNSSNGWISGSFVEEHLLWGNTGGVARYDFSPGDNPGLEFFQRMKKSMEDSDMNNYGVLRVLALVIARFERHIGPDDSVMLNLQLTK